ncbi:uncharacterized protein BDCG_01230 [Blastomyces dermatitidis ER-3]|uniref:TRAPP complex protein TRS85 n=2 Tax=Ajellomyces dermatitidis TaxID=5039 RepID=F2TDH0_AJEDA|nr:uncharacterized protein BDCG_01230 [Blastomyces dermatitidis ER-3]EEQ84425.1 hypothetical protein BDCG_01230 [Blastomyces dermatitidis ER-3]EGE81283.1 TRAPP complex protein TRS85 [Blastomyces dermatitidis ATCC 18188]EQL36941.1 hypothetical protein BDFG_01573 [Blastomyces dermatitidis ATCC 26199]
MTSPDDVAPVKPPPSFSPGAALNVSKARYPEKIQTTQPLISSLSESVLTDSPLERRSSLSSGRSSRTASPNGRLSYSASASASHLSRSSTLSPLGFQIDTTDDIRSLIIRAFSPVIGVYASPDTDALVQRKGFKNGFHELIRPFGETIAGKIVIRDNSGSSRTWEDFGVRFIDLDTKKQDTETSKTEPVPSLVQIEQVLDRHIHSIDDPLASWTRGGDGGHGRLPLASPVYKLFLRRLLSPAYTSPHETFMHPVACIIAISSHTPTPLESLRQLYAHTIQGDKRPPQWVYPEYLRYYVLVHDEDKDDITKSTALFDQMKRHFGLHCHLLRLRSNQCVITDDDSTQFPSCEWLTPSEDLSELGEQETLIDVESEGSYIFESDVTAIKAFIREMVAQSVIPHMENRVALWNEQVASRRRGLSGRFMSMSRRWAGFGANTRSSGGAYGSGSGTNYDSQGFYKPDAPEAILRKLADFAFMLRDWKLASSTYELVKGDYGHDKAWRYQAGAHEMCAVSTLLNPMASTARTKLESIDHLLDTASYSYLTRCSDAQNALRTLVLGVELLKSRGGPASDAAAKWAIRILNMGLVGDNGRILVSERVSACYASKTGSGGAKWGMRRRKAAMWALLAADSWLKQGKPNLASICLEESDRLYSDVLDEGKGPLPEMQQFIDNLRNAIQMEYFGTRGFGNDAEISSPIEFDAEETREKLDDRVHRKSLRGGVNPLESTPVTVSRLKSDDEGHPNDDFE